MKFRNKCVCCNRAATKQYRGYNFCDDCLKRVKRRKAKYIVAEKYVGSLAPGFRIYRDIFLKLK